jgi:hypothetical protein
MHRGTAVYSNRRPTVAHIQTSFETHYGCQLQQVYNDRYPVIYKLCEVAVCLVRCCYCQINTAARSKLLPITPHTHHNAANLPHTLQHSPLPRLQSL